MKVILLKDVPKLGKKFDVKNVSDGFALNSLIPQGLVAVATDALIKKTEGEKALLAEKRKKEEADLAKNLDVVSKNPLEIRVKANAKGHLFSSIHKAEIAVEIHKATGVHIDAEFVKLEKPLKEVGEHVVEIAAGGKVAKLKLVIKALE
jgi:large subunit ribosomal protein L9